MPKSVRLAIGLALAFAPAWGATLELLSLNDLISKSTAIVQGRVTASAAAASGSIIYTHYQVTVEQQWKGNAQTTFDVLVPGGAVNGLRQTYPGTPQLLPGQDYVLFLWTNSRKLTFTIGFTQGVFILSNDGSGNLTANQLPATETMLGAGGAQVVNSKPISMPLSQLVAAITAGGTGK